MSEPTHSYLKVPYDIRTAKQVERRMIVDALHRLTKVGFNIKKYQYVGMGSIYFVDYILFHRFLGMHNLVSVEYSPDIKKRIAFNRPFGCIDLKFGPIGDVVSALNRDLNHVVWLDYDDYINSDILIDVVNAAATLARGSILLVTVDVEPPIKGGNPREWMRYFKDAGKDFCDPAWSIRDFALSNLFNINCKLIEAAAKQGLLGRDGIRLIPIFNFSYADGHHMMTMGGMIGSDEEADKVTNCDFADAVYIRRSFDVAPYRVPLLRLTRKERMHLDSAMPLIRKDWMPKEFELAAETIRDYAEVYRYLPSYAELLL